MTLLLEQGAEVRVLALPGGKDPDSFIKAEGAAAYTKLLNEAPPYVDYLISRARKMDMSTGEGKLRAVNFLVPYVQRIPDRILRSEWASRIAQQLRIEEPVLRESMRKAASERRSEVKSRPELVGRVGKPAERRLVQLLIEGDEFRAQLAQEIRAEELHRGLESERILEALIEAGADGSSPGCGRAGHGAGRSRPPPALRNCLRNRRAAHLGRGRKLPGCPAPPPRRRRIVRRAKTDRILC